MASKLDISELNNVLNNELKVIKYEFEKLRDLYAELKSCCNANKEAVMNENIEKHVEKILSGYFPPGTSKEDLTKNIHKILASRDGEGPTIRHTNLVHLTNNIKPILFSEIRLHFLPSK